MLRDAEAVVPDEGVPAHYAVIVVGGGVNGCATFRDLSLQGVDCLLVERDDFASGASAAPSRLIHGGIKYLETGEIRLVRQSTYERNLLLRNAPHAVAPIETVLPIRSVAGGVVPAVRRLLGGDAPMRDRGLLVSAAGLALFDLLGRRARVLPRPRVVWRRRLRAMLPGLPRDVIAAGIYHDAKVTLAERLVLELVLDGEAANAGSRAWNHTAVVEREDGGRIVLRRPDGGRRVVTADVVINAGGAAIDRVNACLGLRTRHIGGQKGSHLVVDHPALRSALGDRMVYFGASDGRVALLYGFGPNVLVGATDIPVGDDRDPVCEDAERRYLLDVAAEVFPTMPIRADQVVYSYAGVRPLPRSDGVDPGRVSRDHAIREDRLPGTAIPVLSLVGGKWTTFRGFAAEAADRALARLGRRRLAGTEDRPIGGGADYPATAAAREAWRARIAETGVGAARAEALFARHGTRALAVARWCAAGDDAVLGTWPGWSRREIGFIARHEHVVRLADIVFRRTDLALSGALARDRLDEVASAAAEALGWDDAARADEIAHVVDRATRLHGVRLEQPTDG